MKRTKLKVCTLAFALCTTGIFANELDFSTLNGYGPYQTGEGGEFTFGMTAGNTLENQIVNGYYSGAKNIVASPSGAQNFQTFCVSSLVIYGNQNYSFQFNNITATGVPLSEGAAWLYQQFATGGNFGGGAAYDYANLDGLRSGSTGTSADLLQKALWSLMGNVDGLATPTEDPTNPFEVAAVSKFGSWNAADAAAGANNYDIYVMNVYNPGSVGLGQGYQDELIYVGNNSVPDGGSTCAMLGLGLSGVALVARRLRR